MNEEFTLLDAMEAVDEYITEKKNFNIKKGDYNAYKLYKVHKSFGNYGKDMARCVNAEFAADSANMLKKRAIGTAVSGTLTAVQLRAIKKLLKKYNELENKEDKTDEDRKAIKKTKAKIIALSGGIAVTADNTVTNVKDAIHLNKNILSSKRHSKMYDAIDAKEKKKTEAVDDLDVLRLNVYESFEKGIITAEEKANMLELLNLDNYMTED